MNKILKIAEKMRDCSLGRRNEILHFKRGEMSLFNVQKKINETPLSENLRIA